MTFVNRVSIFFLGAMAVALAGYSAAVYFVARNYLYDQFDARLTGAMDILAASVEVEEDDAKWEPQEHGIRLDRDVLVESRWIVSDERGQMIDRSPSLSRDDPGDAAIFEYSKELRGAGNEAAEAGDWRILQRQLNATSPKPIAEREPHEFASVRITVARSMATLNSTMNRLLAIVVIVPCTVCFLAALVGRRYVQRALRPVGAMAEQARSMGVSDFGRRMPIADARDELGALGEEFNRLLDRLQEEYERQRRFAGDAAHQLRSPLAVVLGQIDVALRRERGAEEYAKTLGVVGEQARELARIVEALLFLARTGNDAARPSGETIRLNGWLTDYSKRWATHPRAGDFSLQLGEDAAIETMPTLLAQLLDNLVNNAFMYSAAGTPVVLRGTAEAGDATVAVEDRGIGISPEDRPHIFDPFYRSAEARRKGIAGTGLGLAIAARIAAALGGTLRCDGVEGGGARFELRLPRE